jgi:hypothetical protein
LENNKNKFIFFCEESYLDLNTALNTLEIPISDYKYNEDFIYLERKQYANISSDGRKLAFKFVGIIALKKKVICVFPKYYYEKIKFDSIFSEQDYEKYFSEFIQIIKVVKKYQKSISIEPLKKYDLINTFMHNEMIIADEIIEDYILNGIYNKQRDDIAVNLDGNIDWNLTVNELHPIFNKNRPIYNDLIVNLLVTEEDYIITLLHKWAVKYCLSKYGQLLDYDSSVFQEDAVSDISEIGKEDFLMNILQKELNETFIDRNIHTIKLLRSLINRKFDTKQNRISIYGAQNFHRIWQEVCSAVFSNDLHSEPACKSFKKFIDAIPQPNWQIEHNYSRNEIETLEPDIICADYINRSFYTLDPKYYNIRFDNYNISDQPGVGDVTKQILYEQCFKDKFKSDFNNWYNILIFPNLKLNSIKPWKIFGNVSFKLNIFGDNKVRLMYLFPEKIYAEYLAGSRSTWGRNQLGPISSEIETEKY